jgi:hypothetical protein
MFPEVAVVHPDPVLAGLCCLGLPLAAGIITLAAVLATRRRGRRTDDGRNVRDHRPRLRRSAFSSITPWAVLCCWAGLCDCLVIRWAYIDGQGTEQGGLINFWVVLIGGETWQGITGAVTYLLLAVFLTTTSSLDPMPRWRPLLFIAAALLVLCTSAYFVFRFASDTPRLIQIVSAAYSRIMVIINVEAHVGDGPAVSCLAAVVLLIMGSVQLSRVLLARPHPVAQTPAEGETFS